MKIRNVIITILLGSLISLSSEQCVQTGNGNGLPFFENYGFVNPRITLHHQAIIPGYQFTCCGVITEWGVDVSPGGRNQDEEYTIDFQVWRPSPTTPQDDTLGTGYYSLVGNNRFSAISLRDDVAEVTPSPQDYIQFRPGDILGLYVEEARVDDNGVVVLTTDSFTSEVVWHASVDSQNVGGRVSAGSNGNLNTLLLGAPVISISTSTFSCPTLSTTEPSQFASTTEPSSTTELASITYTESSSTVDPSFTSSTATPTDPSAVGAQAGLIAAIVSSFTVIMLLLFIVILFLVSVLVYKRRRKSLQGIHEPVNPNLAQDNRSDGDTIKVERSEAYGMFTHEATTATDEELYTNPEGGYDPRNSTGTKQNDAYNYPAKFDPSNTVEMKQNDAYTLEEPVTTATNGSYDYPAKFDPSNTIEAKPNEAYAMSTTTEKNEAYKPVVHDSGTCDEYDYI